MRNKIIQLLEANFDNDFITEKLYNDINFSEEKCFEELKEDEDILDNGSVVCFGGGVVSFKSWLNIELNNLRNEIEFNNKMFKNISKHDIIRHSNAIHRREVEFSNKAYHLQNQVVQLEKDKRDLQVKLERARCCVKCYECKDDSCINNIWFKK